MSLFSNSIIFLFLMGCPLPKTETGDTDTSPPPGRVFATDPLGGGTQDPMAIEKFVDPLVVPSDMPMTIDQGSHTTGLSYDYYEIAERQFSQQILPSSSTGCSGAPCPSTVIWGYGSVSMPGTLAEGGSFYSPALTIQATVGREIRVKWLNQLIRNPERCHTDTEEPGDCNYLPPLLAVDQTLHWANPTGHCVEENLVSDCMGTSQDLYTGPVPMSVHLHGGDTEEYSDGYPEAWTLPDADNIPAGYQATGSFYSLFQQESPAGADWTAGSIVDVYPNVQPAATLWFHDHTLGMTRTNVYSGPAGFYLLSGGAYDVSDPSQLPTNDDDNRYEIPLLIQDRSFNADGSLFYPDNRAFFEGLDTADLQIPFAPDDAIYSDGQNMGPSDVAPHWNPEVFGNVMVVNGRSWPYQNVEARRYRYRVLNGSQARVLMLKMVTATDPADASTWNDVPGAFWQLGADQGFLPAPVQLDQLLLGPSERADVLVDYSRIVVPEGQGLYLVNVGPDEPYQGGEAGIGFASSHPGSTGQVMAIHIEAPDEDHPDTTLPPEQLQLPALPVLPTEDRRRQVSLVENESMSVMVGVDAFGDYLTPITLDPNGMPFGPTSALLGTMDENGNAIGLHWSDPITENIANLGDTEVWEIYNTTMDAHPIHIHLVEFQVVEREDIATGVISAPEVWEAGFKDTVLSYPGQITRVKATFKWQGLYVWHCHILEHEDNDMMRPFCVGGSPACDLHNQKSTSGM